MCFSCMYVYIKNNTNLISRDYIAIDCKLVYFYINYYKALYEVRELLGLIDSVTSKQEKLQNLVVISSR